MSKYIIALQVFLVVAVIAGGFYYLYDTMTGIFSPAAQESTTRASRAQPQANATSTGTAAAQPAEKRVAQTSATSTRQPAPASVTTKTPVAQQNSGTTSVSTGASSRPASAQFNCGTTSYFKNAGNQDVQQMVDKADTDPVLRCFGTRVSNNCSAVTMATISSSGSGSVSAYQDTSGICRIEVQEAGSHFACKLIAVLDHSSNNVSGSEWFVAFADAPGSLTATAVLGASLSIFDADAGKKFGCTDLS